MRKKSENFYGVHMGFCGYLMVRTRKRLDFGSVRNQWRDKMQFIVEKMLSNVSLRQGEIGRNANTNYQFAETHAAMTFFR